MPRYHFHTADGHRWSDLEGSELPDLDAARVEAVRFCGEMLRSKPRQLWTHGQWRVEVTDQSGILMSTVIVLGIDAPPAPGGDFHEARAPARSAPSDKLALADRLADEGRSDEEIERLAGVTLREIIALRAHRATKSETRGR